MKLSRTSIKLLVTLAAASCLLPGIFAQTAAPAVKTADKPTAKNAAPTPKAALALKPVPAGKPVAVSTAPKNKTEKKPTAASAAVPAPVPAPAEKPLPTVAKRDPFLPLINEKKEVAGSGHLPPGKAGLEIGSLHVNGTVRSSDGMIAVLANADDRVYFVREGDRLYDGDVEKIGLDGVTFRQSSKDAFGKPVERVVTKRIYASAGEQQ